jgi:NAD(P)-dependent dehydrogenase (short-subunit alcohol dehydrogenase family)
VEPGKGSVIKGTVDGMGGAAAERLALGGWNVLALDIAADELGSRAGHDTGSALVADVTSLEDNAALSTAAEGHLGRVPAPILDAGVPGTGAIDRVPLDDWRRVVENDPFCPILGIRALPPALRGQGVLEDQLAGVFQALLEEVPRRRQL